MPAPDPKQTLAPPLPRTRPLTAGSDSLPSSGSYPEAPQESEDKAHLPQYQGVALWYSYMTYPGGNLSRGCELTDSGVLGKTMWR